MVNRGINGVTGTSFAAETRTPLRRIHTGKRTGSPRPMLDEIIDFDNFTRKKAAP